MFTLLMANIQGETLICVSNSDREGTWTQLRLRDSDAVVSPSQVRPSLPGPSVGFSCNAGPGPPLGDSPEARPCRQGRGQGRLLCVLSVVHTDCGGDLLFQR